MVEVSGEPRGETTRITMKVTDTGCGIPEEKCAAIFDEFEQVDGSSARRHDGAGLGLAITKRICNAMGGSISVESTIGQGSTFTVVLPLRVDETKSNLPSTPLPQFFRKTVAIVDDNAVNRDILKEQLSAWGLNYVEFDNPFAFLKAIKHGGHKLDLAILDYQMPELNGSEVATRLREGDDPQSNIPLILLTSAGPKGAPPAEIDDLFDSYLVKPARAAMLVDAVANALQKANAVPVNVNAGKEDREAADADIKLTSSEGGPLKVLVAEDNAVNQMVVKAMLDKLGCETAIAENGRKAVERFQDNAPDVILMDLSMPEMDGIAATAEIRGLEAQTNAHVPIIGVTAHAMKEDKQRCLDAGMDDYLSKPVTKDALAAKLSHWADYPNRAAEKSA
ncbi:MAG: response regulator [Pseudomonadota bacterium]